MRSFEKSRAALDRARGSLAGGVSSPFRAKAPVPLYFENGCGARLRDIDGNEYIDYCLAWGPCILGHRHPRLVEALRRQAELPIDYGAQHELEYTVAEQIQAAVPCAERLTLSSSGTEAVQLAMRLVRAASGRNLIVRFEGHYHGWVDSALISYRAAIEQLGPAEAPRAVLGSRGQSPNSAENVLVARWNDAGALENILRQRGGEIAAVMMEPVLCNSGCLLPRPGYLERVRELCDRHGCLLLFDEVITGFRMSLGGAQRHYGVKPDVATFGKAVAGGAAVSVVAGRADILDLLVDGGVAFGGSFNGNPMALACAHATLSELASDGGAALAHANRLGSALMDGIRDLARRHGIALDVRGFGAAFALHFTGRSELHDYRDTLADDTGQLRAFLTRAVEHGVYPVPDGRFYVSAAHTERDAEETLAALARVFATLR